MQYLLATDSARTTAAACEYLSAHLEADDAVHVVGLGADEDATATTASAAATIEGIRTDIEVTTAHWDGQTLDDLLAVADDVTADEYVVCSASTDAAADGGLDRHVGSLLQRADCPVRVATA
ncbi:hypothetical protein [Haloarchaeobius sp. DFWS5]|uniref:hypothetical protein n=1 Tax=Haloarchaeobius sp. DFWS5 TaxID=3446114 RepID=UPI003EB999F4